MAKPRCKAKTKAGTNCKAAPLRGGDYCSAHDPTLPDGTRFGSPAQASEAGKLGGGHNRRPRLYELLEKKILEEARADEWLAAQLDALTATRAVVIGSGKDAYTELVPDHPTRVKAAIAIADRLYGRPTQRTELTGDDGDPVQMEVVGEIVAHNPKARKALADARRRLSADRAE